jgi:HAD superfamily hydrolase (TIGR01509 family)
MMFELVIFDCDGVLVDSETIAARIHAEALSGCGYAVTVEEMIRRFTGIPDRDMYAVIERELGRPLPADYDERARLALARTYRDGLQAIPGVHETLAAISLPACVASSGSPETLEAALRAAGLYERFAPNIFSASQVQSGKPAPDLFLFAAGRMAVAPRNCLVVEDSVAGVTAAVAAGMTVFGFTGAGHCGPGHAEALAAAGARLVFDAMPELPAMMSSRPLPRGEGDSAEPSGERSRPATEKTRRRSGDLQRCVSAVGPTLPQAASSGRPRSGSRLARKFLA